MISPDSSLLTTNLTSMVGIVEIEMLDLLIDSLPPLLGALAEIPIFPKVAADVTTSKHVSAVGDMTFA